MPAQVSGTAWAGSRPSGTEHALPALPVGALVDVECNVLVFGFLDEVPQDERGDSHVGAAEQFGSFSDQPVRHANGHGLESACVGESEGEGSTPKPFERLLHVGFDVFESRVSVALQEFVVSTVGSVVLGLLSDEASPLFQDRFVIDLFHGVADRRDEERHHQRCPVHHV